MAQGLRPRLPMQGLWVPSLVRELRSHMSGGQKSKPKLNQKNRSNITRNSIKTLKRQNGSGLYDKVGWGGDHGVRYRTKTSKYRTNKVGLGFDTSMVTSKTLEQKQVVRFPEV